MPTLFSICCEVFPSVTVNFHLLPWEVEANGEELQGLGPGPGPCCPRGAGSERAAPFCGCTQRGFRGPSASPATLGVLLVQSLKTLLDSVWVHAWPLRLLSARPRRLAKVGLSSCRGQRADVCQQRERKENQTSPARTPSSVSLVIWEPGALTLPEPPVGKEVSPVQWESAVGRGQVGTGKDKRGQGRTGGG